MKDHQNKNQDNPRSFNSPGENMGKFDLRGRKCLIPEMNRIGCNLLAGTLRGFGVDASVMETGKGIDIAMEYSSGKECYPCHITLGDILYYLRREKKRLGESFNADNYVYFLPEADGPCRFGMYNKYQRIVLDSFPELRSLKIASVTTQDGYSLDRMMDRKVVGDFKKSAFLSLIAGDILDRLLWRIRPYEKELGMADNFIERAMIRMADSFEDRINGKGHNAILDQLEDIIREGKEIIDPDMPRKPLIGVVGEIYLRNHTMANQDLIRTLERYGAEVVNASVVEWVNFISYNRLRNAKNKLRMNLKQLRLNGLFTDLKSIINHALELWYQEHKQEQVYRMARDIIDIADDHHISHLEEILKKENIFSFDVGTEACLSIPGILEYAKNGYNGVVNVYPFTCMPSTITSAVISPLMNSRGIPYIDTPYDSSIQPGRESALRTFMYQAGRHMKRYGRKNKQLKNKCFKMSLM